MNADRDQVWQAIDAQRLSLTTLLKQLSPTRRGSPATARRSTDRSPRSCWCAPAGSRLSPNCPARASPTSPPE